MRQIFLLLSLIFSLSAFADGASSTALNLLSRNGSYVSDSDILRFMRTLRGDTISLNITAVPYVDFFKKEVPDTIWIKNRPKKNPQEGKHYKLSYTYKGTPIASGDYRTPTTAINGKPFGVLAVDNISDGSYYSLHKGLLFKLIDLDDLSVVECLIPHNNTFSFTISSNKFDRDLKSIIGREFYVNTGNGYSTPKYTLATLNGGEQTILFDGHIGDITVRSTVALHFVDKDGYEVPFKYDNSTYSSYRSNEAIVSKAEHEDKYTVRTINSDVNFESANSDTELPFAFRFILGERNGYSAYMSQNIDPQKISSYPWTSSYKTPPADALLFVGGSINVRGTKFYKMIMNGKAFFMKADDVKIDQTNRSRLDSLERCTPEIQEQFWNKTLFINQVYHYNQIEESLNEVQSYAKYGLAIKSWEVYDESEYTDGTSIRISFLNPTEQVIKYISITFQGYNAVDDPYGRPVTKRCVGPIEPKETANYNFEYVWFTDVVEYAKIRSITVTYKNGATKTITNPKAIMLSDKVLKTIFSTDPVENFK